MNQTAHIQRTRAYLVNLSKGEPIQIDQEEIDKVVEGVGEGSVIVVKRGVINPSYFVSITEDRDRLEVWLQDQKYGDSELKPLKSIYPAETALGKAIQARYSALEGPKVKRLN